MLNVTVTTQKQPTKRAEMRYSTSSSIEIATVTECMEKIFDPISIRKIAHETKFVQRRTSRLDGSEIFRTLILKALNPLSAPLNIICADIAEINPRAEITVQALQQRINSPLCSNFLAKVLLERVFSTARNLWKNLLENVLPSGKSILTRFKKIWVADSTEFPLQKSLSKEFKGTNGANNSEALLKIFAIYEIRSGMLGNFVICDRNLPDQKLACHILQQSEKDELVLMDRGFFSIDLLDNLDEKSAFYITRLHGSVGVYKQKNDEIPISIGRYVSQKIAKYGFCDEVFYLGKKKSKIRIVALQKDKAAVEKELREYHKRCKKAGRMASEENIARISVMIWITNLFSLEILPHMIAKLYGVRWQIELIFKCWKSQLKIQHCRGTGPHRIRVLVLSRLAVILIIALVSMIPKINMELFEDKELSMPKVINWLQQGDRFKKLIEADFEVVNQFYRACKKWLYKIEYSTRRSSWMELNELSLDESYVA